MLPLVPISIQQSRFRTRAHGERDVKTALVSLTPLGTWNLKNRTDNYISKSFGANWRQLAPIGAALVCGHTPENRQIGANWRQFGAKLACGQIESAWTKKVLGANWRWRQLAPKFGANGPPTTANWRQLAPNWRQLAPKSQRQNFGANWRQLAPKYRQFGAKLAPIGAKLAPKSAIKQIFHITLTIFYPVI